ncbi:hypothetical protein psal_cds_887 [Pandoravirus salinus]|uniref:Uncharacterized protein n=1 Tax=Pandoravirus salinus TaxID=1349410 RepID=S4VX95_9VIRU|nr:hypothetical protein psal_cds_887 [Pandoravirus salinus]AGO84973.2 hypothetical protein psal_cds_887 [Pandoravirus salinus]
MGDTQHPRAMDKEGDSATGDSIASRPTVDGEGISLSDLPREILLHIVHFIDHPSDLLAVQRAGRLFGFVDVARGAADWAARPARAAVVIGSRAPLDLVARALPLYADHARKSLLEVAVGRGRLDVVRLAREFIQSSVPGAPCRPRLLDVYRAVSDAALGGHVDTVRYLLSRRIGDVHGRDCGWGAKEAAATGNVSVFVFAHDVYSLPATATHSCRCDAEVGRAAWGAERADVALWMRDFGCAGYRAPDFDHLVEAILQGYDSIEAIARHMGPVTDPDLVQRLNRAVASANAGHHALIMAALDAGLPIDPTAFLISAVSNDDVEALASVTRRFPPTQHMVRAAILAAAFLDDEHRGVRWLAQRWPDAVDATLITACIVEGSWGALATVRCLESVLETPYDWQRAAGAVLASQNVSLIAYAVEQKGVVLDQTIMVTEGFVPRPPAVAYLVQRYGHEHTQALYDIGATFWGRRQSSDVHAIDVYTVNAAARQDGLCVAAYDAMFWARERDHELEGPAVSCACASCGGSDEALPTKRRRVEAPPPPGHADDGAPRT